MTLVEVVDIETKALVKQRERKRRMLVEERNPV